MPQAKIQTITTNILPDIPLDTRRRFNVYTTSIRRRIDVEMTSCVYWDISKSKDNQAMRLCRLIKYNVRNIFLQKSSRK